MQLFYVIAAFLACTVAPSVAVPKRCDQLPTTIVCDAKKTVEPQGTQWMMYKSTLAQQKCLNMSYVSNRNNNQQQATFTAWNFKGKFHIPMKVDVNTAMTSWTLTGDMGTPLTYHKLCLNEKSHWWCVYACDGMGEKIQHAFCGALDAKGQAELDTFLANNYPDKDLPLMDGQTLGVVYDKSCMTESS